MTMDLPRLRQAVNGRVITSDDTGYDEVRALFYCPGGAWERLASVKRRYDPANLFRRNQKIPPAG